jgi:hypothetical protein
MYWQLNSLVITSEILGCHWAGWCHWILNTKSQIKPCHQLWPLRNFHRSRGVIMLHHMRFEVFTMMKIHITVVWVIKSYCNPEGDTSISRNMLLPFFRAIVESGRFKATPWCFSKLRVAALILYFCKDVDVKHTDLIIYLTSNLWGWDVRLFKYVHFLNCLSYNCAVRNVKL